MEFGFNTPFAEQLAFFRQKLNLPSERWDDIQKSAHDRAFIVAGAMKADLLADLNGAVERAIGEGTGLDAFRRDFKTIVKKHGWTGWTGEGSKAGEAWRTRVIYQTNLATSYAAGQWRQLNDPEFLQVRPYWRYRHADWVMNPRLQHLAWNGLVLRHDHPFWQTHFPPNGWGCRCSVDPVDGKAYAEAQAKGLSDPPEGWDNIDAKTGAPVGIAKGFDYAPGANATRPLKDFIDQKLIQLEAPIGAALWQSLKPALAMERQLAWWETLDSWLGDEFARKRTAIVGTLKPSTVAWLQKNGRPMPLSAEIGIRDALPKGAKQRRHEADQTALTLEEWRSLPAILSDPGAIYLDTDSGKLIFVAEQIGPAKIAVEFAPSKLKKTDINLIESAFRVSDEAIFGAVKGNEWLVVEVSGRQAGVEPA